MRALVVAALVAFAPPALAAHARKVVPLKGKAAGSASVKHRLVVPLSGSARGAGAVGHK